MLAMRLPEEPCSGEHLAGALADDRERTEELVRTTYPPPRRETGGPGGAEWGPSPEKRADGLDGMMSELLSMWRASTSE